MASCAKTYSEFIATRTQTMAAGNDLHKRIQKMCAGVSSALVSPDIIRNNKLFAQAVRKADPCEVPAAISTTFIASTLFEGRVRELKMALDVGKIFSVFLLKYVYIKFINKIIYFFYDFG